MPRDEAGFAGYYLQTRVVRIVARRLAPGLALSLLTILLALSRPDSWLIWPLVGALLIGYAVRRRFENTVEREAYSWRTGCDSEWSVRQALAAHLDERFYLLNDVELPGCGGNIDHVVVGPSGIHTIETKGVIGMVDATSDVLLINGYSNSNYLSECKGQRAALRRYLREALPGESRTYPIYPVIVFTRASEVQSCGTTDGVCVEDVSGLLRLLDKYSGSRRIDELHRAQVFRALTPHVASAGKRFIETLSR